MSTPAGAVAPLSPARRLLNSIIMAVGVGAVSAGVALAPALFIQAVFIGEAQRCAAQIAFEQAANDEVTTTCAEDLADPPFWFPTLIVGIAGGLGAIGGFAYGATRPPSRRTRRR